MTQPATARIPYDDLLSMYAEVLNGVPKDRSRFRTVPGFSTNWDDLVVEAAELKQTYPGARLDIPSDG